MKKPLRLDVEKLDSAVLAKIHGEIGLGRGPGGVADFDTHIKGVCDIHGKGDHIKGDGPNYYKLSSINDRLGDVEEVLKNYGALVERLAVDVAAKIKTIGR